MKRIANCCLIMVMVMVMTANVFAARPPQVSPTFVPTQPQGTRQVLNVFYQTPIVNATVDNTRIGYIVRDRDLGPRQQVVVFYFYATNPGKANITFYGKDGGKATVAIDVVPLTLTLSSTTVQAGGTITARIPANIDNFRYSLTFSNPAVASAQTATAGGQFTINAKAPGTTIITVKSNEIQNTVTAKATLTVTPAPAKPTAPPMNVIIRPAEAYINKVAAMVTIKGGKEPYTITPDKPIVQVSQSFAPEGTSVFLLVGLTPGTAMVTVRDAEGQTFRGYVTVYKGK